MRDLTTLETHFIAGADALGDAMISIGAHVIQGGDSIDAIPATASLGVGDALGRAGQQLVDAGVRRNGTTGGGPPGGGPGGN